MATFSVECCESSMRFDSSLSRFFKGSGGGTESSSDVCESVVTKRVNKLINCSEIEQETHLLNSYCCCFHQTSRRYQPLMMLMLRCFEFGTNAFLSPLLISKVALVLTVRIVSIIFHLSIINPHDLLLLLAQTAEHWLMLITT